ncbi:DUF3619 family protein [Paraburkholderia bonniea]|uniref:DUF3619 family protein n=1 Tax=Paraburkholderia bonniea TaxID=2152891 RepID=UPI00129257B0|nr:DUF3619 family protein [Paraburkholderia bonniea]WJF91608.1 DUF3619 family protein [Paraburkholderia bonniea]WJF94927.1 DUF3619 family protein [Paraburkholderia bonniea]
MSPTPEPTELEFTRQLRRALDESAANLAPATLSRLAAARHLAVAQKKPDALRAPSYAPVLAGTGGLLDAPRHRISPLRRLALVWPLAALLLSLAGIAYWEDLRHTSEVADIDAAMLNDDLPLKAYLDHGFNAYLARRN